METLSGYRSSMITKQYSSSADAAIRAFNDSWLSTLNAMDVVYSDELQNKITETGAVDVKGLVSRLRDFDFCLDPLQCPLHRRGFVYTEDFCLYWRIAYEDAQGKVLLSRSEMTTANVLRPMVFVETHSARDDYEEAWLPNLISSGNARVQ